jgi:alpha-N-acetylglucosaminidase
MREILADMDTLVSCHATFSLQRWIAGARAWGNTPELKAYYEMNARSLLTIWGDSAALTDYANRSWAGLINHYYAPRWDKFIREVIQAAEQKTPFDEQAFYEQCLRYEKEWIQPTNIISYTNGGDGIALARQLYQKYEKELTD